MPFAAFELGLEGVVVREASILNGPDRSPLRIWPPALNGPGTRNRVVARYKLLRTSRLVADIGNIEGKPAVDLVLDGKVPFLDISIPKVDKTSGDRRS